MDCSKVVPGCVKKTFAELTTQGLVPAWYFQHSCMYRWDQGVTTSWMFDLVWKEYGRLVTNYKYPSLWSTSIQQFEKDTYTVCANQKKCAGFGLSALLSAYFAFSQQCQRKPMQSKKDLKMELEKSRGLGYGGADGNIKYWDENPTLTYQILNEIKPKMDDFFLNKVSQRQYDYCPCQTYDSFHRFVNAEVIPPLAAGLKISDNQWLGRTKSVYVAKGFYEAWRAYNPTVSTQITNMNSWCRNACK